jgi:hypothetical protein
MLPAGLSRVIPGTATAITIPNVAEAIIVSPPFRLLKFYPKRRPMIIPILKP